MSKPKNEKNRQRNIGVNFRMTPMEKAELDRRIELSGIGKQNYFIRSLLYQKLVVVGDRSLFELFKAQLNSIESELKRIEVGSDIGGELLLPIRTIIEIMQGLEQWDKK